MKTLHTIYTSFAKRLALTLTLLLTLGVTSVWGAEKTVILDKTCFKSDASNYQETEGTIKDTSDGEWKVKGYGMVKGTSVTLGKGNANYLQTPNFSGNISKIKVTCSGSYYLQITDNNGNVVCEQQKVSNSPLTYTVSGSYSQLKLFSKRFESTSNAATTITEVVVTYNATPTCEYSVIFDGNGNTGGSMDNQTFTCDVEKQLTANSFTRTGYTFAGWNTKQDGSGDSYSNQQSVNLSNTNDANVILYAQWTLDKYTVNFTASPNGYGTVSQSKIDNVPYGTDVTSNSNTITINGTTVTATFAAKDANYSYSFNNWTGIPSGNIVTANCTITANFTRTERELTNYRTSCSTKEDPNISWSLNTCVATMEVDNEFPTLTNPYDLLVKFSSSDPTVATIDENGNITLLKAGTTVITATYEEDEDYLPASVSYTLTVKPSNCKWIETDITNINSGDKVVVTMTTAGGVTYALPSEKSTGSNPEAQSVTVVDGNTLKAVPTTIVWIINKEGDNLTFESLNHAGYFLDCTNDNAGVRVSNGTNRNRNFVIDPTSGYLKNTQTTDARYLGVHNTNYSWYCYTTYGNNTGGQTLKFYKKECLDSDEFRITYNLTGVTCTNPTNKLSNNSEDIELNFTANAGYQLPANITVLMGGEELDPNNNQVYIWEDGTILIDPSKVTGDIIITIDGCELLDRPSNLTANTITSTSVTLSWSKVDHAESYEIFVTDIDKQEIIRTTDQLEITIEGLTKNTYYAWDVKALAPNYCSDYSLSDEWVEFTTLDVFTVTYNNQGIGSAPATQTVDAGSKITAPANPSAAGYTFNYWYTTDANVPFDFNTPITGNTTLNAKWTPNVYTITFYKQSGTGGTDNATVTFNSNNYSVSTIEAPTRDKYAFGGYYTEQHGAGIQVVNADGNWLKNVAGYTDANGNWIKAENTHLYAKWTAIYTITWVVNNNTETPYHTSTVLSGSTIDQLPTPPADNLFADCDVNAFVGWSTDNIGLDPDPTAPADLFKTVAEAQNKIGAISVDKKFYAVYASEIEQIATFEADGLNGLSANSTLKWTHDNSGISLAISAGQRYTGSPKTFTITNGTNNYCEIVAPEGKSLKKAVVSITGNNYKVNSVSSPWSLSTSNTTQTITTSTNATDLKMYATSSYQIRITQVDVTYTTYSNYITRCTALPDPVWGGATIDKTEIAVNCGETSSTNGAAKISFLKATNYNLYKDITVEVTSGNFIIASSRDGEYSTSVTLTPTQSGTNVGTLDGKYVYVRAVAPAMSDEDFTGTITISGKQLAQDQVIEVTAEVSCTQYTLTFNDQGQTKTVEGFAGTSVVAPEPWVGICTEPIQYVFDGWAETPVANGTEEYEKINFSTYTMPGNNTTVLYAVYRYAEEGGEPVDGFVKVTEALSDWTGDYVIVNETAKKAIGNEYAYTNTLTAVDVEITDNHQVQSPTNNIIWQVRKHGEYYTMYNESARKYAYVDRDKTEGAGLSSTITGTTQDVQIIFNSGTAKVSGVGYYRCFYYNSDKIEWRTYATGSYNTGALYRFSEKTLRYTSSLVCGSIEAENAIVTSTVGQTVKVYVPITLEYSDVASITGTSDNEAFTVVTKNDVAVGESTIEVHYKPTAYVNTANQEETATITLTTSNGATTTFNVTGRCLPETFAIVAKVGNVWYALPSQGLNSETTPVGYPVKVDNNDNPTVVTSLPTKAEWALRNVYKVNGSNDRFAANGENLVFINAENKTLYANNGNANIQTYAEYTKYAATNPDRYEWLPTTTDLTTYTLKNVGRDKNLSINVNTTFGTHTTNIATSNLRFLPIETTYTPIDMKVVEWYPTKVLVQTETTLASVSVMVGNEVVANPIVTPVDAKLYEISGLPLKENPTKLLTIKYGELACNKVIPIILSQEEITVADALFSTLTTSVYNYSDLVVRDGAKLTINGIEKTPDKFVNVTIYPTAKIVVPENTRLNVYSLTFIGGITEVYDGSNYTLNKYAVPELSLKGNLGKTVTSMDYVMRVDLDQMYQMGVPYDVALSDITYGDGSPIELGTQLYVSAYDGQARANRESKTWVYETDFATKFGSATLKAGVGYTISAEPQTNGDKYAILRLPMKSNISSGSTEAAKTVAVKAYDNEKGVTITANHKGWNYLSNPYMTSISGGEADTKLVLGYLKETGTGPWEWVNDEIRYVTIPMDNGKDYYQKKFSEAELKPFKSFFVQIAQGGEMSFALASRQNAPARYMEVQTEQEVEFEILLSNEKQSDNTGLLIAEQYSPAYEINADLEKMTGSMSVYTIYGGHKLAYNALSPINASEWISLGYIAPNAGEYSYKVDKADQVMEQVQHVYLIDYDNNSITDLINNEYKFYTSKGKNETRFAINVVMQVDKDNTTTGVDMLLNDHNAPIKFIHQDKMYIQNGGTIYDATGKQVTNINK